VVANFDGKPQHLNLKDVGHWANNQYGQMIDLYTGQTPEIFSGSLVVPGFGFYWLCDK
jgi:amylosucrase